MKSLGIALHRIEEVDSKENRQKWIEHYKDKWKCDEVRISKPNESGTVQIREIPRIDMRETSNSSN